jgi:hypothetical protein
MKIRPVGTEVLGEKLVPDMKCEIFVKTYRLTLLKRVAIFSVSKEIKLKLIKTLVYFLFFSFSAPCKFWPVQRSVSIHFCIHLAFKLVV